MTQIFNDFRDMVNDRFRSPFWISTAISWFIWNWRITVTAIFSPNLLTVEFVDDYLNDTPFWYHLFIPLISGAIYSIFSASFKESLEILAKAVRSKISTLDRSGVLYESISITEHNKKVSILERKIRRIESEKIETEEIQAQNDELYRTLQETEERDQKLVSIIENQVLKQNIDDNIKKHRLLKELHDLNFARTLTEDDIPQNTDKTTKEKETTERIAIPNQRVKGYHVAAPRSFESEVKQTIIPTPSDSLEKTLRTYEASNLKDPQSYKTLALVLLQARASKHFKSEFSPHWIGLTKDVFEKCQNSAIRSGLIARSGESYAITNDGVHKLNEIMNKFSKDRFCKILERYYEETKSRIVSLLSSRALTLEQIIEGTPYHPQIIDAIQELSKNKEINKQGELYFIGSMGSE